jgi:hypothetical protein
MAIKEFRKTKFYGGLSDDILLPTETTFEDGSNVNIFDNPGSIGMSLAVAEEVSATAVVVDSIYWFIEGSDGNKYAFGNAGNIYKRTTTRVWTLVYTDANGAILGACEYNGYIYWATSTKLSRKPFPGVSNWSDVVHDWKTLTASAWHPMIVQSIYLLIGNLNTLATVDDVGNFVSSGTSDITLNVLATGNEINCIVKFGDDVLVGTGFSSQVPSVVGTSWPYLYKKSYIARWDLVSSSWNSIDEITDRGITAMIIFENVAILFSAVEGNIYSFDGSTVTKIRNPLQLYSNTVLTPQNCTVYPGAVSGFKNRIIFVIYEGEIIYSLGRVKDGYPLALCPEFRKPVAGHTHNFSLIYDNLLSGSIAGPSFILGHGLEDATDKPIYGLTPNFATENCYVKLSVLGSPETNKTFLEYSLGYTLSYPFTQTGGAALSLNYWNQINNVTAGSSILLENETSYFKYFAQEKIIARLMGFSVSFTAGSSGANKINVYLDHFYCKWNEEEKL